jgi:hypothetical protein
MKKMIKFNGTTDIHAVTNSQSKMRNNYSSDGSFFSKPKTRIRKFYLTEKQKIAAMKMFIITVFYFMYHFSFTQINYDTVYTKTYGNPAFHTEGTSVAENSDAGLILSTGYNLGAFYCNWQPKLYKADESGDTTWSNTSIVGNGRIIRTFDGNFAHVSTVITPLPLVSSCNRDTILACKFNANGDTIWTRKFHFGLGVNYSKDIIQTADSGFAVLCFFSISGSGFPYYNGALIKLDKNGNTEWIKYYGSTTENFHAISVVETSNQEFAILSFTIDSLGRAYKLIKTNTTGDVTWTALIYADPGVTGYGDLDLLPGNEFVVGISNMNNDFMARINNTGSVTQFQTYTSNGVGPMHVKYLGNHDANLLVSRGKFRIIDQLGGIMWSSINLGYIYNDVIQLTNNDIVGIGYVYTGATEKIFLVRLTETETTGIHEPAGKSTFKFYPNPFTQSAMLEFENPENEKHDLLIYNSIGQILLSINDISGNQVRIERNNFANGLYYFQLQASKKVVITGKFIIE